MNTNDDSKADIPRWVNATGAVSGTYGAHIQGLLDTYKPGATIVLAKGTVPKGDPRSYTLKGKVRPTDSTFVPGTRKVVTQSRAVRGKGLVVVRTVTRTDAIRPWLTERHRAVGVTPINRTVTRTDTWVIPPATVKALRKARGRKARAIGTLAIRLLDGSPTVPLNVDTWGHLMGHVTGKVPAPSTFGRTLRAVNAIGVGKVSGITIWHKPSVPTYAPSDVAVARDMAPVGTQPYRPSDVAPYSTWVARRLRGKRPAGRKPTHRQATYGPNGPDRGACPVRPTDLRLVIDTDGNVTSAQAFLGTSINL